MDRRAKNWFARSIFAALTGHIMVMPVAGLLILPTLLMLGCDSDSMTGLELLEGGLPTDSVQTLQAGDFRISVDREGFLSMGEVQRDEFAVNQFLAIGGLWVAGEQGGERRASGKRTDFLNQGNYRVRSQGDLNYGVIHWPREVLPGRYLYPNWADDVGAPTNADGSPEKLGDAMVATVYSSDQDAYDASVTGAAYSRPLRGLTIYQEVFAHDDPGYDDVLFVRFILTNTSTEPITNARAAFRADPDLSLLGNSTVCLEANALYNKIGFFLPQHTSYVYIGRQPNLPESCYGSVVGFTFVGSSPLLVPGLHRPLFKGPAFGWGEGDIETPNHMFNTIHGLSVDGQEPVSPVTNRVSYWAFAGDPVTSSGHIYPRAQDVRMLLATNMFELQPGQSAEAVLAIVSVNASDLASAIRGLQLRVIDVQGTPRLWNR